MFVVGKTGSGAEYTTIQAALDAVPAEGGLVRLPPGRFEITKPLVLSRSDVTLVGAGAATHIHNANIEGQPALLIRHRVSTPQVPMQ